MLRSLHGQKRGLVAGKTSVVTSAAGRAIGTGILRIPIIDLAHSDPPLFAGRHAFLYFFTVLLYYSAGAISTYILYNSKRVPRFPLRYSPPDSVQRPEDPVKGSKWIYPAAAQGRPASRLRKKSPSYRSGRAHRFFPHQVSLFALPFSNFAISPRGACKKGKKRV